MPSNPIYMYENVQRRAEELGYILLMNPCKIYAKQKIDMICDAGHKIGPTAYDFLKKERKCVHCHGIQQGKANRKYSIETLNLIAKNLGGKCISKTYFTIKHKYKFICAYGHKFTKTGSDLLYSNQWCPVCSTHISELMCRFCFEAFLGHQFSKVRPDWLRNSSGNKLELDGYNQKLRLAFEYDGRQHYESVKHYGAGTYLKKAKKNDYTKDYICKEKGIVLIRIPFTIKIVEIKDYIYRKLVKNNFIVINKQIRYEDFPIDFKNKTKLYISSISNKNLIPIQPYIKANAKIKHKCLICSHIWKVVPSSVKNQGTGCPKCAENRKIERFKSYMLTMEEVRKRIHKSGYIWKDNIFRGAGKELKLICPEGHEWSTTMNNFWDTKKDKVKKHCKFCYREKICLKCGSKYLTKSNNSKYCPPCRRIKYENY